MSKKRESVREKGIESLDLDEFITVIRVLVKQLDATKKVYFSHQGVVKSSRTIPDHAIQFRAAVELAKLQGAYPRRGERESGDLYDRSERPFINLVIP
jgi:hypothetical protein